MIMTEICVNGYGLIRLLALISQFLNKLLMLLLLLLLLVVVVAFCWWHFDCWGIDLYLSCQPKMFHSLSKGELK